MLRTSILISCVVAVSACHERDVYVGDLQEIVVLPAIPNRNVDLLFVIDTSPSMLDEQQALVASFPLMMDALATLDGGLPNLHIGVITTDMGVQNASGPLGPSIGSGPGACSGIGDDGLLHHDAPELAGSTFISDVDAGDGTRLRNYTGALRDVFASIASVGADGCGFEQPLAAVRRALENPANGGFLRPDANLAIVILSDEDDCSALNPGLWGPDTLTLGPLQSFRCTKLGVTCEVGGTTPTEMDVVGPKADCHANTASSYVQDIAPFTTYLASLKADPYAVMIAAIVGDPTHVAVELAPPPGGGSPTPRLVDVCAGDSVADPAVRIAQVVDAFSSRSILASICGDLVSPLTSIGYTAKKLVGDPCVDVPLADTSEEVGSQTYCEVVDGPLAAEQPLPACDGERTTDCWRLAPDPVRCARVDANLRFEVHRSATPTAKSYAHLKCITAK